MAAAKPATSKPDLPEQALRAMKVAASLLPAVQQAHEREEQQHMEMVVQAKTDLNQVQCTRLQNKREALSSMSAAAEGLAALWEEATKGGTLAAALEVEGPPDPSTGKATKRYIRQVSTTRSRDAKEADLESLGTLLSSRESAERLYNEAARAAARKAEEVAKAQRAANADAVRAAQDKPPAKTHVALLKRYGIHIEEGGVRGAAPEQPNIHATTLRSLVDVCLRSTLTTTTTQVKVTSSKPQSKQKDGPTTLPAPREAAAAASEWWDAKERKSRYDKPTPVERDARQRVKDSESAMVKMWQASRLRLQRSVRRTLPSEVSDSHIYEGVSSYKSSGKVRVGEGPEASLSRFTFTVSDARGKPPDKLPPAEVRAIAAAHVEAALAKAPGREKDLLRDVVGGRNPLMASIAAACAQRLREVQEAYVPEPQPRLSMSRCNVKAGSRRRAVGGARRAPRVAPPQPPTVDMLFDEDDSEGYSSSGSTGAVV